ncbi:hypothetical protein FHS43_004712 [Streptosporangium becharense]|uniref:Uncharacterized protein n=1 Tax=Streptosporangium becharense TaxID=1816182 RepID=A0A7W9MI39_9ACTN|nr:hypothetical protein [Streptosporangium becharense]MBB2913408.1 hypothetical protein [Streptosporangium becharense]MBB5821098.1 hypothetical protein [Streptosporangium becharense]
MTALDTATQLEVSPGLVGFLVVAGLGLALYLLVKSMRKQLSRIEVPSEAEVRDELKKQNGSTAAAS